MTAQKRRVFLNVVPAILGMALAALPVAAQQLTHIVTAEQFTGKLDPNAPDLGYFSFFYYNSPGSTGAERYYAPLVLPAGTVLTGIQCWVYDASAASDVDFTLWNYYHDVGTNTPGTSSVTSFGSSGSTGYQQPPSPLLNHTIRYNDGNLRHVYHLSVDLANDTRLRDCRFTFTRGVSPAPSVATFVDVPTNHVFFRFIEALASAGITGGCGAGMYCPNNPVTRGEIAVFLSRSLGLYFRN